MLFGNRLWKVCQTEEKPKSVHVEQVVVGLSGSRAVSDFIRELFLIIRTVKLWSWLPRKGVCSLEAFKHQSVFCV